MVSPLGRPHPDSMDVNEALAWTGFRVDDVYGARVGTVQDIYVDHETDSPCWILVKMGRFSDAHALLPIKGKGSSDWSYSWIPVVGPLVGGGLAGLVAMVVPIIATAAA